MVISYNYMVLGSVPASISVDRCNALLIQYAIV